VLSGRAVRVVAPMIEAGAPAVPRSAIERPTASADWRDPVRLTLGGLLAFAAAQLLHLPEGFWAVVTALIVMRAEPRRTLRAGSDRLLGAMCGAAVALASTLVASSVPELLRLALVLAATSSLVAWRPGYRTAPITAIIVLSSGLGGTATPLAVALLRVAEIVLGGLIGYAVSWLFAALGRMLSGLAPSPPSA
jgi:uncharacterized membrane protein YccC